MTTFLILGLGALVLISVLHVHHLEQQLAKEKERTDLMCQHALRLEDINFAAATQPAYFFNAGCFGTSTADEIDFLTKSLLNGTTQLEDFQPELDRIRAAFLDIPQGDLH